MALTPKERRARYHKGATYRLWIQSPKARARQKQWSQKNSQRRRDHIATLKKYFGGCMDCGFNGAPEALDFDHRPGERKLFSITASKSNSWYSVLTEMAKCDLVCANCHRIRTACRFRAKELI